MGTNLDPTAPPAGTPREAVIIHFAKRTAHMAEGAGAGWGIWADWLRCFLAEVKDADALAAGPPAATPGQRAASRFDNLALVCGVEDIVHGASGFQDHHVREIRELCTRFRAVLAAAPPRAPDEIPEHRGFTDEELDRWPKELLHLRGQAYIRLDKAAKPEGDDALIDPLYDIVDRLCELVALRAVPSGPRTEEPT